MWPLFVSLQGGACFQEKPEELIWIARRVMVGSGFLIYACTLFVHAENLEISSISHVRMWERISDRRMCLWEAMWSLFVALGGGGMFPGETGGTYLDCYARVRNENPVSFSISHVRRWERVSDTLVCPWEAMWPLFVALGGGGHVSRRNPRNF